MSLALVTGGGGAKGAFSVGALLAMRRRGLRKFDLISGTSTGSFIAALAAADELDVLQMQYLNVGPNDILAKQNLVANLINKRAFVFDSHPLLQLVRHHITDEVFDRIMSPDAPVLCVTAVSLQTGKPTVFTNRDLDVFTNGDYFVQQLASREELVDVLLASGSQAGFFPAVNIRGEQFVDGGHRDVIPTRIVVDLDMDDVIVLSNNPEEQVTSFQSYDDLLSIVMRVIGIFVQDVRDNDVRILREFLDAKGKSPIIIAPTHDLDEENPTGLRFNPIDMMAWMGLGEVRANEIMDQLSIGSDEPPIV